MLGISAATEEEGGGPGFHTRDLQRRYEGGGRREKDLGSRPGIYNPQKSVVMRWM
jgi:hypothetical protein